VTLIEVRGMKVNCTGKLTIRFGWKFCKDISFILLQIKVCVGKIAVAMQPSVATLHPLQEQIETIKINVDEFFLAICGIFVLCKSSRVTFTQFFETKHETCECCSKIY